MAIDQQFDLLADRRPDCSHPLHATPPVSVRASAHVIGPAQLIKGRHLDRREPLRGSPPCSLSKALGAAVGYVAVDVRVEPNALAHGTAKKRPDGHTEMLAHDVPQRLFDPTKCRVSDAAGALPTEPVPDRLDPQRVLPNEALIELRQHGQHQAVIATVAGLAQAR